MARLSSRRSAARETDVLLKLLSVLLVAAGLVLFGALMCPAEAAPECGPRDELPDRLMGAWGETRASRAMDARGLLFEVWTNVETGTYTATLTTPGGVACIVSEGRAFEGLRAVKGDPA